MTSTGSLMKARRKELGFSAEYVAEKLGVSPATVYRYEKGDIEKIPGDILEPLAAILHTTPKYLMGWENDTDRKPTPVLDLSARGMQIGKLYDIANERDQKIVDTVLDPYKAKLDESKPSPVVVLAPATHTAPKVNAKVKRRKDGFVEIQVYEDQLPAAGYSSYFDTPRSHIEQYPANLIPDHTNFGVPVGGNSMEPKLANHATAFIQSTPRIESGEIGLFSLNGEPYIKQLIVDEKKREVRLHSANPIYEDIVVHEFDDLRVFGRVLGGYPAYKKE